MSDQAIHLFDHYFLDLGRGCVTRAGVPVHLRRQTYEVLKYLVQNRGHLISKNTLIEEVWQGRAVTDGSLGKCIEEVREALGAESWKCVRNERGRGYIFDPEIPGSRSTPVISEQTDLSATATGSRRRPESTNSSQQVTDHRRAIILIVSAVAIVATVSAVVYFKYLNDRSQRIKSIAVLPFVNATADSDADYISDGITESLIDQLAKSHGLKVIARSSSFTFRGPEVDVKEIGRALDVQALVTGRVLKRGDTLVVSAELVDTKDRSRLWGGEYTHSTTALQNFSEEIAVSIAEKLHTGLSDTRKRQSSKSETVNPQAYQYYLNGLFHFNQGGIENLAKALEYFDHAVLLDPNFALAWAWISRANGSFSGNSWVNPRDVNVKAKVAAEKALKLDDTLADAHFALGRIKQNEWDWAGAERAYKRAIELSPSLVLAHVEYAQFLSTMQRHAEASSEIKRAQELDPFSIRLRLQEAWLLHLARRSDEALKMTLALFKKAQPTAGNYYGLGFVYEGNGMYEEAVTAFRQALSIGGETTGGLCYLANALALAGKRREALAIVDRLNRTPEYVSPTELAGVYTSLNDKEAALKLLERAYAERDLQLQTLNIDLHLDNLRSDPRFQDLVKRVGLP